MNNSISIIIPIYNADAFLEKCINSIIQIQHLDWELILVDDGSTDSSAAICEIYSAKNERVHLFQIQNGGVSLARNFGLQKASKENIAFIDADDWIDPEAFQKSFLTFINFSCDMAFTPYTRVENKKFKIEPLAYGDTRVLSEKEQQYFLTHRVAASFRIMASVWRVFYKKKLLSSVCFNESFKFHEDALFLIEIVYLAKSIAIINIPFYFYEVSKSSVSSNVLINNIESRLKLLDYLVSFAKTKNQDFSFALACRRSRIYAKQFAQARVTAKWGPRLWKELWVIHESIPLKEVDLWEKDFLGKSFIPYAILMRLRLTRFAYFFICLRFFFR